MAHAPSLPTNPRVRAGRRAPSGDTASRTSAVVSATAVAATLCWGCGAEPTATTASASASVNATATVAPSASCGEGGWADPPRARVEPALRLFRQRAFVQTIGATQPLVTAFPRSPMLRILLGESVLLSVENNSTGAGEAATSALLHYQEALRLVDAGCTLDDEWAHSLALGESNAHLRLTRADAAVRTLEAALRRWPDSPELHYAAARAYAVRGAQPEALQRLRATFELARQLRRPRFARTHQSFDGWLVRASEQPEFAALRRSREWTALLQQVAAPPSR